MDQITWGDFERIEMRVGTILDAVDLPNARVPAYVLVVDFGAFGQLKSSARITDLYSKESLIGRQVLAVLNFPEKQVGSVMSQCLVTGFLDDNGYIVLASVERNVPNGTLIR